MRLLLRRSVFSVVLGSLLLAGWAAQAQPRAAAPGARPGGSSGAGVNVKALAGMDVQSEDIFSDQDKQMYAWVKECAAKITVAMERWVKGGKLSQKKLFSQLYIPIPNTDPQKFHTDYDTMSDQEVGPIEEAYFVRVPEMRFVVLVDRNGYLPTHNGRYSQPLTGHHQIDLVNNRTKRIFNDRTGYRAARNANPFLLQAYFRDTGEIMKDLSVPIFLFGKHWGGLRFGYMVK